MNFKEAMETERPILYEYLGGRNWLSFKEWSEDVIQDHDEAVRIAKNMIDNPTSEYIYNENDPIFIQRFTCFNDLLLNAQIGE